MLLIDLMAGKIISDEEIKNQLCSANPYKEWLENTQIILEEIDSKTIEKRRLDNEILNKGQKIFGYSQEDLKILMTPMAVTGQEAIGSMSQDETKLRQCVTNFLSNAFKFTQNGLVSLDVSSLTKNGIDMIEFKVTDDGEGMSDEGVSKVFEEYEQAERSTSATHGGTGLGLPISKRFAELMGGGVTVSYNSSSNAFTFTNGTTGSDSTIKVKGAARFGLDNVDLGVGTVPQIYNLVQATNSAGVALYVDLLICVNAIS